VYNEQGPLDLSLGCLSAKASIFLATMFQKPQRNEIRYFVTQ